MEIADFCDLQQETWSSERVGSAYPAVTLRRQSCEKPPAVLDLKSCQTQLLSDGQHFGLSVFSLDFG